MKALAVLLSLSLAVPALAEPPPLLARPAPTQDQGEFLPPVVIVAPRLSPEQVKRLKTVRTAGTLTAVSGTGLLAYGAFAAGTGPIGWAAGLIFIGGMSAYLAHRRLKGNDDFRPTNAAPSR